MAFLWCVMYFSAFIKVSDRSLVGNKIRFRWNLRLASFASSFILAHNIHVTRAWVSWSKEGTKRRSLMKWTINFCNNITKRQQQRDLQSKPVTDSTPSLLHFQPTLTPTARRQRLQHGTNKISPSQTTVASVKVDWKIKTVSRILPDDLGSIRKTLCGGA